MEKEERSKVPLTIAKSGTSEACFFGAEDE